MARSRWLMLPFSLLLAAPIVGCSESRQSSEVGKTSHALGPGGDGGVTPRLDLGQRADQRVGLDR